MKVAKSSVFITSTLTSLSAVTVADRTFLRSAARSPTSWPGPRSATTRSSPLSLTVIRVQPLRITIT